MFGYCSKDLFFAHYVLDYMGLLDIEAIQNLYSVEFVGL